MKLEDADRESVHEPVGDEADPLDFLSRHPLPKTGNDKTEKIIRWNAKAEHVVLLRK